MAKYREVPGCCIRAAKGRDLRKPTEFGSKTLSACAEGGLVCGEQTWRSGSAAFNGCAALQESKFHTEPRRRGRRRYRVHRVCTHCPSIPSAQVETFKASVSILAMPSSPRSNASRWNAYQDASRPSSDRAWPKQEPKPLLPGRYRCPELECVPGNLLAITDLGVGRM